MTNPLTPAHTHHDRCYWSPENGAWVCDRRAGNLAGGFPEPPLVDVRDMIVVHTAMLREFRLAPAAVCRVAAGDRRQAAVVGSHLRFVCDLLHHHHTGEDELLWPLLRERMPAPDVLDNVEAQHDAINASLGQVGDLLDGWLRDADADLRARLADQLRGLHDLLAEHLDLEERVVLPVAAATLTPGEWGALGAAAAAATPKQLLPLVFGMFSYEGDPAVITAMLSHAPLLPRLLLPRVAPRVYARRAKAVHGTARP